MQQRSTQWRTAAMGVAIAIGVAACREAPTAVQAARTSRPSFSDEISQGIYAGTDSARVAPNATCGVTTIYGADPGYSYAWSVNGTYLTSQPEFNLRNSGSAYYIDAVITAPDASVTYAHLNVSMGPAEMSCPIIYDDVTGRPKKAFPVP